MQPRRADAASSGSGVDQRMVLAGSTGGGAMQVILKNFAGDLGQILVRFMDEVKCLFLGLARSCICN